MSEVAKFFAEVSQNIESLARDLPLQGLSNIWIREITRHKYSYNFTWMGRPIIQFPQDIIAMQEIIWSTRPDIIIETGVAHGGSLIFYASMLELLGGERQVIGVDIDIRSHNREQIESHPMSKHIRLVQGSSIAEDTLNQVKSLIGEGKRILVVLDSNHTHSHVLAELHLYSRFVCKDSYVVVFDTVVEDMPPNFFPDRPWGKGDNPKTAVYEFLRTSPRFVIDKSIDHKLLLSVAPDGYLKCIAD